MIRNLPLSLLAVALTVALSACNPDPSAPDTTQAPPPAVEPTPAPQPAPASGLGRFDGYGDLRFGMTEAEARAAWGGELNGRAGDDCHYLSPVWVDVPSDFALMFEGDKFVRYDVGNDTEVAPGGGKRGMNAQEIRDLYAGRVEESVHKYVAGGSYLKVEPGDGSGGRLVFETDADGLVSGWHAGIEPQVDYVEGCS